MSSTGTALPQSYGYGIVVGVGFAFSITMIATTYCLRRYQKEIITSEEFSTAGRSVKTGLIASAVVSSWTWAATLLQATSQAYKNGVSGPFWYASGATVQIILFATVAIELKKKAPGAHTYLEIIKERYGTIAHVVYMVFAIATNILVTAMLITGGAAVVNDLTGMHIIAACLLLPLGVMIYTLFGGIKATFLTDYVHSVIMLVIIIMFTFTVYVTSPYLGSPGVVYDLLKKLATTEPLEGNAQGSYLTMKSQSGGIFFVINLAGNFGTVFLDNGYWNKAIAATPAAALPGYILGGFAWFAIPFVCATTMGLAGLVLQGNPNFPGFEQTLSADAVSAGLVLPTAATALLGTGGASAALLMVFMAVTSATSAELIAVSSVMTYDVYKTYINPKASGKQLIYVSHLTVVGFGFIMAGFSIGLYYAGVSLGYLYLLMGVIISAAVLPASMSLFWNKLNVWAAAGAPVLGFIFAVCSWLGYTKAKYGTINVTTSGSDYPMLIGNVVALCSPLITVPTLTFLFKPDNYDFEQLKNIRTVRDTKEIPEDVESSAAEDDAVAVVAAKEEMSAEDAAVLHKYSKFARWMCLFMVLCFLILWPMPMYGSGYIFSKKFFTGWVVVGFIWIFFSLFAVTIYPLWESRVAIFHTLRGIYWDLTGQTSKLRAWQKEHPEELHHMHGEMLRGQVLLASDDQPTGGTPSVDEKKE